MGVLRSAVADDYTLRSVSTNTEDERVILLLFLLAT